MGFNQGTRQVADEHQEYLTGEQLAKLLQVSVKSVSRWAIRDPSMPVLRIGRTVRFPRERLIKWLKTREQGMGRTKQPEQLWVSPRESLDTQGKPQAESVPCARL